jgi:uncharacterized protein (DUF697 family)
VLDDTINLPMMGLKDLVDLTSEVIPEGKRRALAASQKASIGFKKNQSHKIVATAATAAGAVAMSPVPMSDIAMVASVQIGMIAGITSVFGLELSKGTLSALVSSAIGVTGTAFAGRAIIANLLKFFPGAGSIAGGAISVATASALTVALGEAYISVLVTVFTENPEANPDAELLGKKLQEKMRNA